MNDGSVERFIIDKMERDQSWRMFRIMGEFVEGFDRLRVYDPSVTIYGSARVAPGDALYEQAQLLGHRLAHDGYAIVTGGGPGVMEAANKGAAEAGGVSIGLNIDLPNESPNHYQNVTLNFHYFFVRKVMLVWRATAFVLMPGGLGTLDELFETITLISTEKITPLPVILFGRSYWEGLAEWLRHQALPMGYISATDLEMLTITDDIDEVCRAVNAWRDRGEVEGESVP
jgi:uncharacterized protein (TIGR00730 family)